MPRSPAALKKALLILAFPAVLTGCGGEGATGPTGPSRQGPTASAEAATQADLARSRKRALADASSVDAKAVLDWAEYKYPNLFAKGPASFDVDHEGKRFTVRAYVHAGGTRYLGVTTLGEIYGLGDFTGGNLQGFGVIADYAAQVAADACSVNPAGCGGSGIGGNYLVYGVSSASALQRVLNVVDPAAPTTVVLSSAMESWLPLPTVAMTFDAGSRSYTRRGEPYLFFQRDRALFRVALSKPGSPAAVRVSSQADVCSLFSVVQLDPSGEDAWLWISTGGADGNCDTPADNVQALVRSTASSSTPATPLPRNATAIPNGALYDTSGRLQWMLVSDSSSGTPNLVAYGPTLARINVAGGNGVSADVVLTVGPPGAGPALVDGVFIRAGSQLRPLTGDAGSLSLAPSVYTFTSIRSGLGASDGSTHYLPDANKLVKVQGLAPATVLATLPVANGDINGLSQTASRVVVRQLGLSNPQATATTAVSKADGSQLQLLAGSSATRMPTPLGLSDETLFYTTEREERRGDLRRMQTDGTGDTLVAAAVFPARGILRTTGRGDFTQFFFGAPVSLAYCTPAAGATDCRTGALTQLDMASLTTTVLGSFTSNAAPSWAAQAYGWDGLAGGVVVAEGSSTGGSLSYSRSDMWIFNPSEAGSLRRVTSTMP